MSSRGRLALFLLCIAGLMLFYRSHLVDLVKLALEDSSASHIVLVPFVSCYLIYWRRREISINHRPAWTIAAVLLSLSIVGGLVVRPILGPISLRDSVSLKSATFVLGVWAIFIGFYGIAVFRFALFPGLLLAGMIPLPEHFLRVIVQMLIKGSAEATEILFELTGTTYFRDGGSFSLAGINIDIAPECSGIRSSIALFITCLLGGYLMLRRGWSRALLVLIAVPVAMLKNAIRIVTLSLLAVHMDPRFLTNSSLHRDGGILFFLLALLLIAPILLLLRRLEQRSQIQPSGSVACDTGTVSER